MVAKVFPEAASTNSLLMKILVWITLGFETVLYYECSLLARLSPLTEQFTTQPQSNFIESESLILIPVSVEHRVKQHIKIGAGIFLKIYWCELKLLNPFREGLKNYRPDPQLSAPQQLYSQQSFSEGGGVPPLVSKPIVFGYKGKLWVSMPPP